MIATWQRLNTTLEKAMRRSSAFFADNAWLLGLTIATGVLAYGYELTHLTFSIDEELAWQNPDNHDIWLEQRRWGMYLLQQFVLPHAVYPFTNAALSIVFLSLAAVLLVHRHATQPSAKAIFCVLFISFPTFAHIQGFCYMGAHVALATLLVVVAERLVSDAPTRSIAWAPAWAALTIATATHQSLLLVFPTLVAFSLLAKAFRDELRLAEAVRSAGLSGALMVASVLGYYGIDHVFTTRSNGYVEGYFRWGSAKPLDLLAALWKAAVPFLAGTEVTHPMIPTLVVAGLGLVTLAIRTRKPWVTAALTILLVLSPFSIHLVFGTWMSTRSMMALPFAFAGLWYLIFTQSAPLLRAGTIAFTCYCVVIHSSLISKVSLAQELTYKADSLVASRILDRIYDAHPRLAEDAAPLAFVGLLDPPRSSLFAKDEVFGGSFWQWDAGNPYRMYLFLESLGLPTTVALAPPPEWPRAKALARNMPSWPDKDCVQWRDGLVIVKLSDP